MAKAHLDFSMKDTDKRYWQKLFNDLRDLVLSDKIACPESEFHKQEARLDSRIEQTVGRIIGELSWGLMFSPFEVILESQMEEAAYRFLRKTPPLKKTWSKIFESDPLAPVKNRMRDFFGINGRIEVSLVPSKEFIHQERRSKREFVDEALKSLEKYSKNPLNWPELLLESKKGVIDGYIGRKARQSLIQYLNDGSEASYRKMMKRIEELENLWDRLRSIGINTEDPGMLNNFVEYGLLECPFINIYGSIWAAIGDCYIRGRDIENIGSDYYDTAILATVLPYCDIITTDNFMKAILVKRFGFDNKYGCKIFSANKKDRVDFHNTVLKLKSYPDD